MAKGGNTGAVVFLSIIAVSALGLSGYIFVNETFLGADDHTHDVDSNLRLVAFWDDLDENLTNNPMHSSVTNFLIEYDDQKFLDSNYVSVINNTRFQLVPGLYKLSLNVVLSGIDPNSVYWIEMLENNSYSLNFERLETDTTVPGTYYFAKASGYLNISSVENYYEIVARTSGDVTGFSVASDPATNNYHQFSIEYVIQ